MSSQLTMDSHRLLCTHDTRYTIRRCTIEPIQDAYLNIFSRCPTRMVFERKPFHSLMLATDTPYC